MTGSRIFHFVALSDVMIAIQRGDTIAMFDLASMARNGVSLEKGDTVVALTRVTSAADAANKAGQLMAINANPILVATGTDGNGHGWSALTNIMPNSQLIRKTVEVMKKKAGSPTKSGVTIAVGARIMPSEHQDVTAAVSAMAGMTDFLMKFGTLVIQKSDSLGEFTPDVDVPDDLAQELSDLLGDDDSE